MKKITFASLFLMFALSANAQFTFLNDTMPIQKGGFGIADINSDGKLDVIYNGVDFRDGKQYPYGEILINNGNGNFTHKVNAVLTGHLTHYEFGDIDGDGDLDIIYNGTPAEGLISGEEAGIGINDGMGNFTKADPTLYPILTTAYVSCGFADFDNNGLLDYYFSGNGENNSAIYYQQTDGSFVKNELFANRNFVDPQVTVVDINNDGFKDFFVSAWLDVPFETYTKGRYCVSYINDGQANPQFILYPQPNIVLKSYGTATWNDFNGDGWMDMLLNGDGWVNSGENSDGIVRLYINNNGTLEPKKSFDWFRQITAGQGNKMIDYDNDGDLDILVGGWNDTKGRQATSLYICDDAATYSFTESPLSNNYFPGVSENNFEFADLNNDGKSDLLLMGFNGNQPTNVGQFQKNIVGWCPNNSTNVSVLPVAPANINSVVTNSDVTFTWTVSASETAKKGTTYNIGIKNTTTNKWLYNPACDLSTGFRQVVTTGNMDANKTLSLYGLPTGDYVWGVQAINGAYLGGAISTLASFTIASTGLNDLVLSNIKVTTANGELKIKNLFNTNFEVQVYTLSGQLYNQMNARDEVAFNMDKGIYLVKVTCGKRVFNQKVVF